jgi:hypothetical protein
MIKSDVIFIKSSYELIKKLGGYSAASDADYTEVFTIEKMYLSQESVWEGDIGQPIIYSYTDLTHH